MTHLLKWIVFLAFYEKVCKFSYILSSVTFFSRHFSCVQGPFKSGFHLSLNFHWNLIKNVRSETRKVGRIAISLRKWSRGSIWAHHYKHNQICAYGSKISQSESDQVSIANFWHNIWLWQVLVITSCIRDFEKISWRSTLYWYRIYASKTS